MTGSVSGSRSLTLTENPANSGIFRGCFGSAGSSNPFVNGDVLSATYTDPTDATDVTTDTALVSSGAVPALVISKTLTSPADAVAVVGEPVQYNINVTNTGASSLSTIALTDTYSSTCYSYQTASRTPTTNTPGSLGWSSVGPIAAGSTVTLSVTLTAKAACDATSARNSVTASGDATAGPATATVTINKPAVTVAKTRTSAATAKVGDTVTFDIVITNSGNTNITTLPLSDNYGSCLEFVSATPAATSSGGGTLLWSDVGPLATGASKTIQTNFKAATACNPAQNTAEVNFAVDANSDPAVPGSGSATVIKQAPAIVPVTESGSGVSGTASTPIANVVSNDKINGIAAVLGSGGNATISEVGTWPTGISLNPATGAIDITASVAAGVYKVTYQLCDTAATPNCASVEDTITVTGVEPVTEIGTGVAGTASTPIADVTDNDKINGVAAVLGSGGNATISEVGTWPTGISLDPVTGTIDITASVAAGVYKVTYQLCDTAATPNCASVEDTITVTSTADLSISKSNGATSVTPGGTTTYTLTLNNAGVGPSSGMVTVVDVLPTGLSLANGPVTLGGPQAANWNCIAASNVLTCTSSVAIASAESSVFSFTANVAAGASGTLSNRVHVGGGGDPANVSAPTSATAVQCTAANTPNKGCAVDSDTVSVRLTGKLWRDNGAGPGGKTNGLKDGNEIPLNLLGTVGGEAGYVVILDNANNVVAIATV